MSLSDYEKTQFERLTTDLAVDDKSALRTMRKRDKASAMSYVALPSVTTILAMLTCIGLLTCVGGLISNNVDQALVGFAVSFVSLLTVTVRVFRGEQAKR